MLIDIFFQFSPSYWYKNCDISLKRDFYTNIEKRLKIKEKMLDYFKNRYPSIPEKHFFLPMGASINLQPFIIYMGILGAEIKYFDDIDPWAEEPLIGKILSLKEFEAFDICESEFFKKITKDFDFLAAKYKPSEIDIFGRGGIASIHSPLTTAQKVIGTTDFFYSMMDNPSYLHRVLNKITDHYIYLLKYFSEKKGTKVKHIHFGDCVSFSLPREKYEEFGIKYKNKIIEHFKAESCDIHSCGKSTHLLESYVKVNNLKWVEVSVETDWEKAKEVAQKYNHKYIAFLLNPGKLFTLSVENISLLISGILENNYPVNTIIRTGAIEYNTPDENIRKIFDQVLYFISNRNNVNFIAQNIKTV